MFFYFFSISYGIYLATILEFTTLNNIFFVNVQEVNLYEYFKGRSPWKSFDYHIEYEQSFRYFMDIEYEM